MATTDRLRDWDDDEPALDEAELALPPPPRLRRCGAIHDVGRGPWIGTLACCTRPVDHDGPHAMTLGDPESSSFWQETWS